MTAVGWILVGLIAGLVASKLMDRRGEGFVLDLVFGTAGAIVGGLSRGSARRT